MKNRLVLVLLALILTIAPVQNAFAQENVVVSLGANLSDQQRSEMLELFGVDEDQVTIIEVTNQEERDYLEGLVSEAKIGTRAISSAYVELLDEGDGIQVDTRNINWVTSGMYANAMVTAQIENARVVAAAPFEVSGTAALTGIMKAFEEVSGEGLSEEGKDAANEELVTTGELGEDIGQEEAAGLVREIKERIISENITDKEDIRRIIIEIAAEFNINLTQHHIDQLVALMEKISRLDLNVEEISKQLDKITNRLDEVKQVIDENKGLIQQILDAIQGFFKWIAGLFN